MTGVLRRSELFGYSLLALPLAFAGLPLYIHAPYFYATHHGLPLATLAAILLVIRGWDAVQDPLLGLMGDRLAHRRGWFMAAGMVILVIGLGMLFHPAARGVAVWFAISLLIATSAFGLLTIGLGTLGGLWSDDPTARTRIAGWREGFGLVGLLLAAVLPSLLMESHSANVSFHYIFLVFVVLLAVAAAGFFRWLGRTPILPAAQPMRIALLPIFRRNRLFFAVYFLSTLAASLPAVLVLPFIRDLLGAERFTGLFLALYFLAGAAGMPVWLALSRRIGKARSWRIAMLLSVVSFAWCFFLSPGDGLLYGIICVLSGLALGADLCLPASMLADRIERDDARAEAAQHYALLAFLAKLALALGGGVCLAALGRAGFIPGGANPSSTLIWLAAWYALIPCGLKLGAAFLCAKLFDNPQPNGDARANPTFKRTSHHGTS